MPLQTPQCAEPGRWRRLPDAEAPAEEILAYLQHCDACEYHATLMLEEDLAYKDVLRAASRNVDHGGVFPSPQAPPVRKPFRYERSLMRACVAAFAIVVLWVSFVNISEQRDRREDRLAGAQEDTSTLSTAALEGANVGRLYLLRRGEAIGGQALSAAGPFGLLPVAAPRPEGAILRVTNPQNGLALEARVVRRTDQERELLLPALAMDSLRISEAAYVFVELVSPAQPLTIAP